MDRRNFLRRSAAAAGSAAAALAAVGDALARAPKTSRRPNILWLVSEDNSPYIGAYGDERAHTPAIDALAASGVRYANAFSSAPVCAPSRYAIITGMCPESAGPSQHMRAEGRMPAFLRGFPEFLRDAGYYCTNSVKTDYNAALDMDAMWDESSERAHWRNRPAGAPFFAIFNFMSTHESRAFRETLGRVRPEEVAVPGYLPDTAEVRRDFASYYNLMERMDSEVAARLSELDAEGLADDTIVFYFSDNGGVLPRSKRYCYDAGLRVPLVVKAPPRWAHLLPAAPGAVIDAPVSLMDLGPTVLSMAAVAPPKYMHGVPFAGSMRIGRRTCVFGGRDRMDERYDFVRTARDERFRYIRNYAPHRIHGQHVAFEWQLDSYRSLESLHRTEGLDEVQQRFFREKPAEEFYDVATDPDHLRNLIDAPKHRRHVAKMRAALDAHMRDVNDNGFIPESSPLEGYDASRVPGAYPIERVMRLAGRAIERNPRHAAGFGALLGDANEVIRFWAAQGLLMLKANAAPAKAALQACFEKDPSIPVRIVAAESLATLGSDWRPVRYLGELVETASHARLRLQALNALTFIGEPARQCLDTIKAASRDADNYVANAARYLGSILDGSYAPALQIYVGPAARQP